MQIRVLDLDASVSRQPGLLRRADEVVNLLAHGPDIRIACSFSAFTQFEHDLARRLHGTADQKPMITFVGSGDFHHITLALLRRQPRRCNLLVLDNHPDWMRGLPLLHCGTWLHHASQLPLVERIFHVGGETDFDNAYRYLAPWPMLRSGKITVISGTRQFRSRMWDRIPHQSLRLTADRVTDSERITDVVDQYRDDLGRLPLYVSFDRDVIEASQSVVNWDSGRLTAEEALAVIDAFTSASAGLAGMDVVGDWSPVRVRGLFRRMLHWLEHPKQQTDLHSATQVNQRLTNEILCMLGTAVREPSKPHSRSNAAASRSRSNLSRHKPREG